MKKEKSKAENQNAFLKLQEDLTRLIEKTSSGDKLPSEPELAKSLGVSRATLREAMRLFESRGMLRRRQGVGTFVEPQAKVIESGLEVLESIERMSRRLGLSVTMGELKVTDVLVGVDIAEKLQVEEGTRVIVISRVILTDGRPVAYLEDYLPPDVLSEEDLNTGFTGSVLDFLLKQGGPKLTKSFTDIQAIVAPAVLAKKLEIQRNAVLLWFSARLYDETGKIVDFSNSYFLPGYFRFHVVRRVVSNLN